MHQKPGIFHSPSLQEFPCSEEQKFTGTIFLVMEPNPDCRHTSPHLRREDSNIRVPFIHNITVTVLIEGGGDSCIQRK